MILTGNDLTLADLAAELAAPSQIELAETALERVRRGREVVEQVLTSGETVYGINTGFGRLANKRIEKPQQRQLQENLLRSHASGLGPWLDAKLARMVLLLKINSLARGYSGLRPILLQRLIEFYNLGLLPAIRSRGSVGASGDLAPLADLALPIIGEGFFLDESGDAVPAIQLLDKHGIEPLPLAEKEGLSLINGTQLSTALAVSGYFRARGIFFLLNTLGALSAEVLLASDVPFREDITAVRPHPGQKRSAEILWKMMQDSGFRAAHIHCEKVQDFYSLRCMPQVHGPLYDLLTFAQEVLTREINSTTDNPVVLLKAAEVLSGGNFHAASLAQLMDFLAVSVTDAITMSERRIAAYQDTTQSQLPMFLSPDAGLNSGFMIAHVTAAALSADNRILAHPASVDSVPTSANQEDHVSMAPNSGWKLLRLLDQSEQVLAIELLCACQARDFHKKYQLSPAGRDLYNAVRDKVPFVSEDHSLSEYVDQLTLLIRERDWESHVQRFTGIDAN